MTDVFKGAERLMGMTDAVWRRHANPKSGWSRCATALPFLVLAIWSRVWLGWGALVPVVAALVWIWWNPRAFPEPVRFDAWVSRGVLGEYVFLHHRDRVAVHHQRAAAILSWLSVPGAIAMVWGLIALHPLLTLAGMALTMLPKLWFVDRMAWIYADFRRSGGTVLEIEGDQDEHDPG